MQFLHSCNTHEYSFCTRKFNVLVYCSSYTKQIGAQIMIKAMSNYFVAVNPSSIKHIYFSLADMESIGAYTIELARLES